MALRDEIQKRNTDKVINMFRVYNQLIGAVGPFFQSFSAQKSSVGCVLVLGAAH